MLSNGALIMLGALIKFQNTHEALYLRLFFFLNKNSNVLNAAC